ncbi:PD-(D/E)XK nuclease family protein [Collinsella sp. An2]|uniref:PD-(D/E)XK nuclease family protein n=1 Tax=Collinsella sp. An2 TaxID=1965585 RepID=UPI000B3848CB|nr:PD-(D/E)XK nuclease family protein [Collinsella sp. An2]OUP09191.1 hypothetical protein B5F33_05525 [Collinsella sp. An2]
MAIRILETGSGAGLTAREMDILASGVETSTLLVPAYAARERARRELADAGHGVGIDVLTPASWLESLWELLSDGRHMVRDIERQLIIAEIVDGVADDALAPLRKNPGTVRMIARMARDHAPHLGNATSGASADGVAGVSDSAANEAVARVVAAYRERLEHLGLIEASEAAEQLALELAAADPAHVPSRLRSVTLRGVLSLSGYLVRLLAAISAVGDVTVMLCDGEEPFAEELEREFSKRGCTVERVSMQSDGDAAGACGDVGAVSFLEVAGPHARSEAYAVDIAELARDAAGKADGVPSVAVVAPRPAELLEDIAPRLAVRGIAGHATGFVRFSQTSAGTNFMALMDLARRMADAEAGRGGASEWWPAPELTDWLYSPLSGVEASLARAFDKKIRGDRSLTPEGVMRQLQSVQGRQRAQRKHLDATSPWADVPAICADVFQAVRQGRPVTALKTLLAQVDLLPASAWGADAGRLRASVERAAISRALEVVGDLAHRLGVSQAVACTVLDGIAVSVSMDCVPEGEPCGHAEFLTLADAAWRPAGAASAAFFADVDVQSYPLAHADGPLATLAAELGAETISIEPAALLRARTACVLQAVGQATFARVTHDRQAKDRYPAAIWTELAARAGDAAPKRSVGEGDIVQNLDDAGAMGLVRRRVTCEPPQRLSEDAIPYLVLKRRVCDADGTERLEPRQFSASQIESYATCPLCWFMSSRVRPQTIDAGFGNMEKGNFVHDVLYRFHTELADDGVPRVTPENLDACLARLANVFEAVREEHRRNKTSSSAALIPQSATEEAAVDEILSLLERVVRLEARTLTPFAPAYLEYAFNDLDVSYAGMPLGGRIDRVDVDAEGRAVVIDYKHRTGARQFALKDPTLPLKDGSVPADDPRWLPEHTQTLIYAQALRRALGLDVRAALYMVTKERPPKIVGAASEELVEEEKGDGRIPGLSHGFPDADGGSMTFDELLDRVESSIADRFDDLAHGVVSAVEEPASRCAFNHPFGFTRRDA